MKDAALDELCHHLLNGVLVIKALCLQGKTGGLTPEQAFRKIEHRCNGMEQAFTAIIKHGSKEPEDRDQAGYKHGRV